jgi:hypothetical protein
VGRTGAARRTWRAVLSRRPQDGKATRTAAYCASLLTWVVCATVTSEVAELFGDETEM